MQCHLYHIATMHRVCTRKAYIGTLETAKRTRYKMFHSLYSVVQCHRGCAGCCAVGENKGTRKGAKRN
jgi:hypothetical protein